MCKKKSPRVWLIPLAAAGLLAAGSACAQTTTAEPLSEQEQALMTPESWVSVGAGGVSSEAEAVRLGQYSGLNQNLAALLDFELNQRNEVSGRWTRFTGRDLGLDTRELGFTRQQQGDWEMAFDYNETVRNDPYGITPGELPAGQDVSLKLQRQALGLRLEKWLSPALQVQLQLRHEDRRGERLGLASYGATGIQQQRIRNRGHGGLAATAGEWDLFLVPQPVDSAIRTLAGRLNYKKGDLALSGGYDGSFFVNRLDSLRAQAPDNQAHQLYLTGSYAFSPGTRANFKFAQTRATQNDDVKSLAGVLETALAHFGLTMQPGRQFTLNANLRHEDRDDKSTLAASADGIASPGLVNWRSGSQTRTSARLDGSYRLPAAYTVSMALDWERKRLPLPRLTPAAGRDAVFFRTDLEEVGWHGTVRKIMSETLSGALGIAHKQRRGDDSTQVPSELSTLTMDRKRSQWHASLDWTPSEALSLELTAEQGQDTFGPGLSDLTQQVKNDALTLDAAYTVAADWRVNGYWTQSRNRWQVSIDTPGSDSTSKARTLGVGVEGKLTRRLSFGVDLLFVRDVSTFTGLADASYQTNELRLHGAYRIDQQSHLQFSLVHQRFKTDDWPWRYNGIPFLYANDLSVSQNPDPSVTFVGLTYSYRFP